MYEFFACIYVCTTCVPVKGRRGVRSPRIGVIDGSGPLCVCWELNPCSLGQKKVSDLLELEL